MARAVRFLIIVSGSHYGDVAPETVTGRLASVGMWMQELETPWSIVHGGAPGVDAVAASWAAATGVDVGCIEADWATAKAWAGPQRNRKLLEVAQRALDNGWAVRLEAFPSRLSKGTWDMKRLCEANGILTKVTVA